MKKQIILLLRTLPVMYMVLLATPLYAADGDQFWDGLYFEVISEADKTCKVSSRNFQSEYISITIPSTTNGYLVTTIGAAAFGDCYRLTSITIPNSVTTIEASAFFLCEGLTNITLPYSLTTIGERAFDDCVGLTSITIPGSVTTIGDYAFRGCIGLTSITIPGTVTTFGYGIFYGCKSINSITSMIEDPSWQNSNGFDEITRNSAILHVPIGTRAKYEEWWRFKNIVEIEKFYSYGETFIVQSEEGEDIVIMVTDVESWTCQVGKGNGTPAWSPSAKHITIPQIWRDCTIRSIADDALKGCSSLLTISFPETITSIGTSLFDDCSSLAAVQWNANAKIPDAALANVAGNPNLLLYVNAKEYAPATIRNVVAGDTADKIVLAEADGGNNFYCPKSFIAKEIEFTHNYSMKSGYNTCEGWETLALPFDVTDINKDTYTHLIPIKTWKQGVAERPFWIYEQTSDGWQGISALKANTPYIICIPNNAEIYNDIYNVSGNITFKGTDVMVKASNELNTGKNEKRTLIPNYQNQPIDRDIYTLNVNNQWDNYSYANHLPGSTFISGLRQVRPFEAYMKISGADAARRAIPIFEDNATTGIIDIPLAKVSDGTIKVNSLYGLLVKTISGKEELEKLPKGVYIVNGKKVVVK